MSDGKPHGLEQMHELAHRLHARLHLPRSRPPVVLGVFAFVAGAASIGVMSLAAWATRQPLIFPSLGPTAFLIFYAPRSPAASPRNAIAGHALGVVCGYLALVAFGLRHAAPVLSRGVSLPWVGSAALSLGLTAGLMASLRVPHPPAGATTLIVSLGILPRPLELGTLLAAVVGLLLLGLAINRLAGVPYPWWSPPRREKLADDPAPDAKSSRNLADSRGSRAPVGGNETCSSRPAR